MMFVFCGNLFSMNLEEVLDKYEEARGGIDKIKGIESMVASGKFMMQGMEYPFTVKQKRPNKMRIDAEIQGMTMTQAYNGEIGWYVMPFMGATEPEKMPESQALQFKFQSDMDGYLIDYEEKGYQVELVGKEEMEGTDVYNIEVVTPEDLTINVYLDAEYFLELKATTKGTVDDTPFEMDTYFGDYKEVAGVMMVHSIESKVDGQTVSHIIIDEIEANSGEIDDSIFDMPEAEGAKE
ncbi:MAG: hypothetical protein GF315_07355 [candidate division Zixibacteria bacterium]|nr:hypothetical protein [candidate division Zixibacteria bacterium]